MSKGYFHPQSMDNWTGLSAYPLTLCQSGIKLTPGSIFVEDIFARNQLSAVAVNCDLHTLYWRASSTSENQGKLCLDSRKLWNNLILFHIFVTGHWVAGREHFLAGGKIFSPFWELAICGWAWWAGADWGGMVGSYARWIVSSRHYGRCRHLDRDQLLMLKPTNLHMKPTAKIKIKAQKYAKSGKISVFGIYRIKSTFCKIWTRINSYAATKPTHTFSGLAKIFLNRKFWM